jgi:hypothetical protein
LKIENERFDELKKASVSKPHNDVERQWIERKASTKRNDPERSNTH